MRQESVNLRGKGSKDVARQESVTEDASQGDAPKKRRFLQPRNAHLFDIIQGGRSSVPGSRNLGLNFRLITGVAHSSTTVFNPYVHFFVPSPCLRQLWLSLQLKWVAGLGSLTSRASGARQLGRESWGVASVVTAPNFRTETRSDMHFRANVWTRRSRVHDFARVCLAAAHGSLNRIR